MFALLLVAAAPTLAIGAQTLSVTSAVGGKHPIAIYPVNVGQSFRDTPFAPDVVVIPAGSFSMGSSEAETTREGREGDAAAWERPQRTVTLAGPLAVGKFLVTRKEYAYFVAAKKRPPPAGCNVLDGQWHFEPGRSFADAAMPQSDLDPAVCVDVEDAQAYADWLSAETGHRYRLLHEAEWEYAARAGTTTSRWWGDDSGALCRYANGADQSFDREHPGDEKTNKSCDDHFVGTNPGDAFPANPFGLHDMIGNVWEWTADCFVAGYGHASEFAGVTISGGDCTRRVIRGASWHNHPDALRSAARYWLAPDMRSSSVGFRVARLSDGTEPRFRPVNTLPRHATPHFNFVTIMVSDFDRAFAFYTQALGMRERGRAQITPHYFEVVMGYDRQPLSAGISLTFRDDQPGPRGNGSSSINIVIKDLAGVMARATRLGGKVAQPLSRSDTPQLSYSIARVMDPDGNTLELVEYHHISRALQR